MPLLDHHLETAEGLSQVLQVLFDQVELLDILQDVVVPFVRQRLEPLDIGVGKVAAEPQFGIVFDTVTIFVELSPRPNLVPLLAVVA